MKKIMIIEDSKLYQKKIKDIILDIKYEISGIFEYGEKAIDYILKENNKPDLIIVDVILSGEINGYQVVKKIASKTKIPFIILTAKKEKIKNFEAYVYLNKPFNKEELKNNIELALYKSNIHKKLIKKNEEQEMLLNIIDTQIWYLKDPETYGKVNQAHADFIGLDKSEIENKKLTEFLDKEEAETCNLDNVKVFREKKKIKTEEWFKNSKGQKKLILITKSPKLNKEGKVEYVVCSGEDITDQKRKEKIIKEKKEFLSKILEVQSSLVLLLNSEGKIIRFNKSCEKLTGYTEKEVEGKKVWDLFVKQNEKKEVENVFKQLQNKDYPIDHENYWLTKKGEEKIISWSNNVILDDENNIKYIVGTGIDVTERKREKDRIKIQHKFQKSLADLSSNLVNLNLKNFEEKISESLAKTGDFFDIDYIHILKLSDDKKHFSSIHEWNKNTIDFSKKEVKKLSIKKISWLINQLEKQNNFTVCDVENLPKEAKKYKKFLQSKNIKSTALVSIKINNELFGWYALGNIKEKGICANAKINYINIFTDVITRAIAENLNDRKIEKLTYHDVLTGLYNRRFFEEEVKRLDTERNLPISILVADLNGLKIINDSYGHDKGDEILKKAAQILKKSLRKDEILARQGGDEFAALLSHTTKQDIQEIVKRIKKKCQQTKSDMIPISIALGTATKEKSEEDIEDTVKRADDKMYKNKLSESRSSKSGIIQGLINVLNTKSSETKEHAIRMTSVAFQLGEKLGLSNFKQNRLSLLATLHDIGKINISEKILKKKSSLTNEEWNIIKKHPEYGYKIALSSEEFAIVAEDILAHHERWDGTGYPNQLKGEEIPYLARIISIVDSYDVMIHDRPYSKAISKKEALKEIKKCKGSQFDPELAEVFIEMISEKS